MIATGVFITKRLNPTKHTQTFTIPADIGQALIKNKGQHDIEICFNDGRQEDSYTLERGEALPILDVVAEKTKLKYFSETGKGLLNILLWG